MARRLHIPLLNHVLRRFQTVVYGIELGNDVILGHGVFSVHPIGVVVGGDSRVGDRVRFMGSNTLGTARGEVRDTAGALLRRWEREAHTARLHAVRTGLTMVLVMKPLARREGLVVRDLPDELIVYDVTRHRAHCLSATAALVFKHCNGGRSVEEIARILRRELDVPADERLVWLSLERLERAHLLQERPVAPAGVGRYSRRELVRRLGLAAALLPTVATVLAPTPAEAVVTACIPAANCTGFGTPPNPCFTTDVSLCDGTCACIGAGTCSGC